MPKQYDYMLAVWLRLEASGDAAQFEEKLREYLEEEYAPLKLEAVEPSEEDEFEFSLQVQVTFSESQMEDDEPTPEAVADFREEFNTYLERKYVVAYLEVMEDALTSFLIDEYEDSSDDNP